MGTSTTATLGFAMSFGARSVRVSATRRTTLSPFSISGRKDHRRRRCAARAARAESAEVSASVSAGAAMRSHGVVDDGQELLVLAARLAGGLDAVEGLGELPRELLRRLHGDDLVGDELEGVLDQ